MAHDGGGPFGGDQQGRQHLDRGSLPRAIRTQQAEKFPCFDIEGDVFYSHDFFDRAFDYADAGAVNALQIFDFDCVHALSY